MIAEALEHLAVPIDDLTEHPRNPKKGNVEAIVESLQAFGQVRPILVQASTSYVVAGNHTRKAAKALGWDRIAAVQVDMTDEEALRYLLADNRLADLGEYDESMVLEILEPLAEAGKLTGTGFTLDQVRTMRDYADLDIIVHGVEDVSIEDLKAHSGNYKEHPPEQIEHLVRSIETHGFYRNVVVANDGTILAGHGVIQAAQTLGLSHVPVTRMPIDPDSPEAKQIIAGDNEIGRQADVNDRALTDVLRELAEAGVLEGTGFDESMLANLVFVTRNEGEVKDVNAAAEWVGMPGFDPVELKPKLVLTFETQEAREQMIEQLGLVIAKRERRVVSSWYPPKEREDIEAVRWEPEAEVPEPTPTPEVQEPPVPEVQEPEPEPQPEPTPTMPDPQVPAPPALSPNHPAMGNLTPEELDESGYNGPMVQDPSGPTTTQPEPTGLSRAIEGEADLPEPTDDEVREYLEREAAAQAAAARRETAPKEA